MSYLVRKYLGCHRLAVFKQSASPRLFKRSNVLSVLRASSEAGGEKRTKEQKMKKVSVVMTLISAMMVMVFSQVAFATNQKVINSEHPEAQQIIEKLVSKHNGLVRLTIHAVPTGKGASEIIACNIQKKIGQPSDPEDLEAMKTNKTITLKEGNNLDVTAPVCDKSGKPIAATGITLSFQKGETEADVIAKAQGIALELTAAIHNAGKRLW